MSRGSLRGNETEPQNGSIKNPAWLRFALRRLRGCIVLPGDFQPAFGIPAEPTGSHIAALDIEARGRGRVAARDGDEGDYMRLDVQVGVPVCDLFDGTAKQGGHGDNLPTAVFVWR